MRKRSIFLFSVLFIASSLVLLLYAYLGTYSRLMADDFCSVYDARRFSILRYLWYWYNTWGGRYSAIATDFFIRTIGANGMPFVPSAVLLVWAIVTSLASYMLLQKEKIDGRGLLPSVSLGAAVVFLVLLISPKSEQVLYWWNGMRTYIPALISFTFHVALLYWAAARSTSREFLIFGSVISFLLALFTGGYNETFTTVQFSFFSGLTFFAILSRKSRIKDARSYLLYAAIAGSAAALVIMMTSPGAANRQTYFPPPPGILRMLEITIQGYAAYLAGVLSSPANILGLAALALGSAWIGMGSEDEPSSGWLAVISLAAGLFLGFVSLLPSVYGTSEMPAARTFIVPSYILVISLLHAGLMAGRWLLRFSGSASHASAGSALMLCAGIAFLFSSAMAGTSLYRQRDVYTGFAQRWDQTNTQIIQAKMNGDQAVSIAAPRNWAGLEEPNNRPKYWVTACYSNYYGIQVLGPDPDQPQP